jgi:tetratricopeptide (TPR) repeat protein/predicted Ser/Thr protein kinase
VEFESTAAATNVPGAAKAAPDQSDALPRGATIGRYVLLDKLGAGGMGVVYAAYDPELDRKVALKLLLPKGEETGSDGRARLLREAQALAKLSHPNVVAVHDVGTHGTRVWIAMEFVAGDTLGEWAKGRPRRWPELLRVLIDAARGVAAAHAAGLVHRDLKPDNVMVGRDGRVRVMDFGLAHGRAVTVTDPSLASTLRADKEIRPEFAALVLPMTKMGAVQGTPAYMAPEQWQGREAEPATDQFGWSVMAWEMLYGERPFAGENMMALAAAVLSGQRRVPPRGRGVPKWLRRVVERGLATEPAKRWPTMAAILMALERGRTRARGRSIALGIAGVAILAGGWEGYRRWELAEAEATRMQDIAQREAACQQAGADLESTWNDVARAQLLQAFVGVGGSEAAIAAKRAMPWLDRHANAWKHARTGTCLDHDRGTLTAETLDRALWCLDERRMEFETLVAELVQADRVALQKAIPAAAGLDPITPCSDPDALARLPIPPLETREEARAIRREIANSSNLYASGKFTDAADVARGALTRAGTLTWSPLTAAARLRLGLALARLGKFTNAAKELEEAGFAAMEAGALGVAADAAIALVSLTGQRLARFDDGVRWSRLADLALHQLEPRPGLRTAVNLQSLATVRTLTGDLAGARTLQGRALALQEEALGPDHPIVAGTLQGLATTLNNLAAYPEALAANERSLKIREAVLGPQHSDVARSLTNQGLILRRMGDYPGALAHPREAPPPICERGPRPRPPRPRRLS